MIFRIKLESLKKILKTNGKLKKDEEKLSNLELEEKIEIKPFLPCQM